ncbi:hypothetical protein ETAA8_58610 [Anatilimnocola aggregata]|uniref:Uncharacterized protein n=1 Tax=Anatilimnocola aggregata TaxID=2528021 RepID=A0A517YKG0_9BACT|nr:hypothetical protein ETAA8_58610 [Anatilimnocola aggregata]
MKSRGWHPSPTIFLPTCLLRPHEPKPILVPHDQNAKTAGAAIASGQTAIAVSHAAKIVVANEANHVANVSHAAAKHVKPASLAELNHAVPNLGLPNLATRAVQIHAGAIIAATMPVVVPHARLPLHVAALAMA